MEIHNHCFNRLGEIYHFSETGGDIDHVYKRIMHNFAVGQMTDTLPPPQYFTQSSLFLLSISHLSLRYFTPDKCQGNDLSLPSILLLFLHISRSFTFFVQHLHLLFEMIYSFSDLHAESFPQSEETTKTNQIIQSAKKVWPL